MDSSAYKRLGNVKISGLDKELLLAELQEGLINRVKMRVFFVNAHCFNIAQKDDRYRRRLNEAEMVLNDGIGVELGARFFNFELRENLNGTDFTPQVLSMASSLGKRVFLYGGKPGVAEQAAASIKAQFPGLHIAGVADGYSLEPAQAAAHINETKPDLLLVGLGVPLQENWISEHFDDLDASVIMAVGAFLDFISGTIRRAPLIVRKCRMEWAFRLALEPKRLFKRYVFGNLIFFIHIFRLSRESAISASLDGKD